MFDTESQVGRREYTHAVDTKFTQDKLKINSAEFRLRM